MSATMSASRIAAMSGDVIAGWWERGDGRAMSAGQRKKGRPMKRFGANRRTMLLALASLTALVAAACGGGGSSSSGASPAASGATGTTNMTVELDWVPNPDHVGLYYAQEKGYLADNHVSVTFRTPSNAADPIKLVGLNKVDVAISYEPEMFYGQQEGLPVTAVATVVPVPLNSLIAAPGSGITTLAGVRGKTVGVTGIPSDDAFYQTMLKTAGLSEGDVTKVNVGFNLVPSLLSNKVDAIIGGYRNVEAIQVEQESGSKPTVFPADQLGVPSYAELVVVANSDKLSSDAAYATAVKGFVAALVKGTDGAMADQSGATEIMKQQTQYEPKFLDTSVPYTLSLLKPAAGAKTGCIDSNAWQSYGNWMKDNGLIKSTPDASAISTTDYMPYSCS
jgi:putative hydroxymethylpyrimidine transport system substrate-binding protein